MLDHARFFIGVIILAFIAGVFPDVISHGIIFTGRTGHTELAIVGLFLVVLSSMWFWFSWSLVRRYGNVANGTMEVVKE